MCDLFTHLGFIRPGFWPWFGPVAANWPVQRRRYITCKRNLYGC